MKVFNEIGIMYHETCHIYKKEVYFCGKSVQSCKLSALQVLVIMN